MPILWPSSGIPTCAVSDSLTINLLLLFSFTCSTLTYTIATVTIANKNHHARERLQKKGKEFYIWTPLMEPLSCFLNTRPCISFYTELQNSVAGPVIPNHLSHLYVLSTLYILAWKILLLIFLFKIST